VSNWLKRFTQSSLRALARLNSALLYQQIAKLGLRRLWTLRFLLINRAARVTRISGRKVLRFAANPPTEILYHRIAAPFAA